ncbi:MAG: AsmA family protein [Acidobacteria bacterium]|nr:AsmA family protein [Acidobacteriota bacterium]
MKKAVFIGVGVLAILIVILLLVPPFIDLGAYKARYLPVVEEALQRKVDVGEVRLRIVPSPAIRLSRLNVSDNPAFSKDPFFTAQQVRLQLRLWPLLKGQFHIDEFIVEKPVIHLLKQPDGTFNFADIGKKKPGAQKRAEKEGGQKTKGPNKLSELIPAHVRIEEGDITLQTKGQKPLRVQGIDVLVKDFTAGRPFPYRVALRLPGFKPIKLEGPLQYDESRASLQLRENHLTAENVDFAVNGTVSDLTGIPRMNLALNNSGFETKPIFQALSGLGLTPKELEISGPLGLKANLTGPSNALTSQVNTEFQGLKVNDKRAFHGTVAGHATIVLPLGGKGPLDQALRGNGQVTATDGALTNVDLISKIQTLTGLAGMPADRGRGATTFRTFQTEFALAGGTAEFKRLFLESPVMEALGAGKMTLQSPSLDLAVEAALSPEISARAASGRAATFFKDNRGRIVVPLKITGPVKSPAVVPDAQKLARKGAGQLLEQKKGELFERLFKRK